MIDWKVCESQRLQYQTLEKLSVPELLRLITGVGRCAKRVLSRLEALSDLRELSVESLVERTGIPLRQAERILAGCELGRRLSGLSQVNGESIRDPQPVYELMKDRQGRQEVFAVRVKGESMIDALVADGDLVVMEPVSQPQSGDMVAAWLTDREEVTLKHFHMENGMVTLQPANAAMKPITVPAEKVAVQGRVVGVVRTL